MLKKTVIVFAMVMMLATTAGAAQWKGLIGGAYGYTSSSDMVAFVFNATVNQKIAIITTPTYSALNPYCVLFPLTSASSAVYGYGNDGFSMIAPVSDTYLAACIGSSSSGNGIFLYAFDLDKYGTVARSTKKEPTDEEKAALNQVLQDQFMKLQQAK